MNTKHIRFISKYSCLCLFVCFFLCGCTNKQPTIDSTLVPTSGPLYTTTPTTAIPTVAPTATTEPSTEPSVAPTTPAVESTLPPTVTPTIVPTTKPTKQPVITTTPTKEPTAAPTKQPTKAPTKTPTEKPTQPPTQAPVVVPAINNVSSPEKNTLTNPDNTVIIDISNTAKGYFSVKYTGNNPKVKAIVTMGDGSYTYDINSRNSYIYYPLQMGNGTYTIGIYENVSGKSYMPILQESFSVKITNSNSSYLYPNQYVWFQQDSKITRIAAEVCANCDSDVEKVSAIFKYVTTNISYDYNKAKTVTSGYLPNIDNILSSKKGICFDYASMFAAMCRAQGLPCRLVTGYVPDNNTLAFHAWNQIYTKEKGYITVSFYIKPGYNTLDPTFYSTINDDEKAATKFGDGSQYQIYKIY